MKKSITKRFLFIPAAMPEARMLIEHTMEPDEFAEFIAEAEKRLADLKRRKAAR